MCLLLQQMLPEELLCHRHGSLVIRSDSRVVQGSAVDPAVAHRRERLELAIGPERLGAQQPMSEAVLLRGGLVVSRRQHHLRALDVLAELFEILFQLRGELHLRRVHGHAATDEGARGRVEDEPAPPAETQEADPLHAPRLQHGQYVVVELRADHIPRVLVHGPQKSWQVAEAANIVHEFLAKVRPSFHFGDGVGGSGAATTAAVEERWERDDDAQGFRQVIADGLCPAR
mmetsp:Transcript_68355/g.209627  ORF Transcript_68355/g.209627 Transcript_68355/m.209627 type:complete len:230 (-) Transcript_68355:231-920(-)